MNKLQGFFTLRKSGLPSVPWSKYDMTTYLDPEILWTIRSAVAHGEDLNLPRKVGITADEAHAFARKLLSEMHQSDLIIYYPFFIAEKSGVIELSENKTVIEAVNKDLWNLVTQNKKDVTIIFENDDIRFIGNENFLTSKEILELIDYCVICKKKFNSLLQNGKSIFLEWSFAYNSNINKQKTGSPYFVFYEMRTVN